ARRRLGAGGRCARRCAGPPVRALRGDRRKAGREAAAGHGRGGSAGAHGPFSLRRGDGMARRAAHPDRRGVRGPDRGGGAGGRGGAWNRRDSARGSACCPRGRRIGWVIGRAPSKRWDDAFSPRNEAQILRLVWPRVRGGSSWLDGAWRSLVAHLPWAQVVGRSNRLAPTNPPPIAQQGKAKAV